MSKKDRKVVLIAQCLVNPYCRVHLLGQNFPLSHELMDYLMSKRVGVIQYPCPETTAMGLMRNPQGRQQYDSIFFREHCKELNHRYRPRSQALMSRYSWVSWLKFYQKSCPKRT